MKTLMPTPRFGDIAIKRKYTDIYGVVKGLKKQVNDQSHGKMSLLGDNLVELKLINKSQRAEILDELAMYPRLVYPSETVFGRSLREA